MNIIHDKLSMIFDNKYSSTIITVILIIYASLARYKLPSVIVKLFENAVFRVLILSLIILEEQILNCLLSIGFTITMNIISKRSVFEILR